MTDYRIAARSSVVDPLDHERHLGHVVAEEPVDAVADDLVEAADAPGEDRRAAGERLDRDEPEWLGPRPRHQDGVALGEQRVAVRRTARRGIRHCGPPASGPARRRSR